AAGARLAEPGEFTKRAFLNGRMDLSQAEAVADLISAQTERAAAMAMAQLRGVVGERIGASVENLRSILASLEATIDFSAEDGAPPATDLTERLQGEVQALNALLATFDTGRLYRQGARVVIVGRTNVGKSSLLNRLLGERRAIVTPVPGTTRDFIEETMDLKGLPVRITDTAGIRETTDGVEQAGIDLVWEKIRDADGIVVLFDGAEALREDDRIIVSRLKGKRAIYAINKSDLPAAFADNAIGALGVKSTPLRISAKGGEGIDNLKETLFQLLTSSGPEGGEAPPLVLTTLRHRAAIEKAVFFLSQAVNGAACGSYPELIAADIGDALDALGEISGKTANADILERIFTRFCIGK
ncbi:MAG: tRNA uridine-5-carboxymethylaminomethyl(34) synthesis GTPase MnmE, partial [Syntrophales bacterium]|nr:tRNA uridine-5-carboxymethylaminomethyl(34) synthesis GTPase MnmE [Syntrophales bacterium]